MNVIPLWILCNPRSGSSFLCDLLNNTKKFPIFEHTKLVQRRGPLEAGLAFNEWLRVYSTKTDFESHPVPHTKCIYHQFIDVFGNQTADYIEKFLSGIKFILLRRNNYFEQAASLYFAKKLFANFKGEHGSSSYHIYNQKDLDQYLNTKIDFDLILAKECYNEVRSYETNWDQFLQNREYLQVNYESLIANPLNELRLIMNFSDISITDNELEKAIKKKKSRILPMTRPEQPWFINKLKSSLAPMNL